MQNVLIVLSVLISNSYNFFNDQRYAEVLE